MAPTWYWQIANRRACRSADDSLVVEFKEAREDHGRFENANFPNLSYGKHAILKFVLDTAPIIGTSTVQVLSLGFASARRQKASISFQVHVAGRTYVVVCAQTQFAGGFCQNAAGIDIRCSSSVGGQTEDEYGRMNEHAHGISPTGAIESVEKACNRIFSDNGGGWCSIYEETNHFRVTLEFRNEEMTNVLITITSKGERPNFWQKQT